MRIQSNKKMKVLALTLLANLSMTTTHYGMDDLVGRALRIKPSGKNLCLDKKFNEDHLTLAGMPSDASSSRLTSMFVFEPNRTTDNTREKSVFIRHIASNKLLSGSAGRSEVTLVDDGPSKRTQDNEWTLSISQNGGIRLKQETAKRFLQPLSSQHVRVNTLAAHNSASGEWECELLYGNTDPLMDVVNDYVQLVALQETGKIERPEFTFQDLTVHNQTLICQKTIISVEQEPAETQTFPAQATDSLQINSTRRKQTTQTYDVVNQNTLRFTNNSSSSSSSGKQSGMKHLIGKAKTRGRGSQQTKDRSFLNNITYTEAQNSRIQEGLKTIHGITDEDRDVLEKSTLITQQLSTEYRKKLENQTVNTQRLNSEDRTSLEQGYVTIQQLTDEDRTSLEEGHRASQTLSTEYRKKLENQTVNTQRLSSEDRTSLEQGYVTVQQLTDEDRTSLEQGNQSTKTFSEEDRNALEEGNKAISGEDQTKHNIIEEGRSALESLSQEDRLSIEEGWKATQSNSHSSHSDSSNTNTVEAHASFSAFGCSAGGSVSKSSTNSSGTSDTTANENQQQKTQRAEAVRNRMEQEQRSKLERAEDTIKRMSSDERSKFIKAEKVKSKMSSEQINSLNKAEKVKSKMSSEQINSLNKAEKVKSKMNSEQRSSLHRSESLKSKMTEDEYRRLESQENSLSRSCSKEISELQRSEKVKSSMTSNQRNALNRAESVKSRMTEDECRRLESTEQGCSKLSSNQKNNLQRAETLKSKMTQNELEKLKQVEQQISKVYESRNSTNASNATSTNLDIATNNENNVYKDISLNLEYSFADTQESSSSQTTSEGSEHIKEEVLEIPQNILIPAGVPFTLKTVKSKTIFNTEIVHELRLSGGINIGGKLCSLYEVLETIPVKQFKLDQRSRSFSYTAITRTNGILGTDNSAQILVSGKEWTTSQPSLAAPARPALVEANSVSIPLLLPSSPSSSSSTSLVTSSLSQLAGEAAGKTPTDSVVSKYAQAKLVMKLWEQLESGQIASYGDYNTSITEAGVSIDMAEVIVGEKRLNKYFESIAK